ncbi:hypothetical protein AR457_37925 [Streptomyces agglomeratus]|nr:hypothetical protein AR457_37925 [Streptomyces agglomeratus]
MRGGLVRLARRIARSEEDSSPRPTQLHRTDDDPLAPLFDALDAFNTELKVLSTEHIRFRSRLIHLEDARSTDPAQSHRPLRDPLGPLFDALESINSELTGLAARLDQLVDPGQYERPRTRLLVICPRTCPAAVRAAQSRRAGKAVPNA